MKLTKSKTYILAFCLVVIMMLLVIKPAVYMQATLSGLTIWLNNVLPALFPFFFFSSLLLKLNIVSTLGNKMQWLTNKLFHCSGGAGLVFLISIISGYPVGARVSSDLYKSKLITQNELMRINAFASTSGPLFIVGAVGVGMFHSQLIGFILLLSHYVGAILNGVLFRNYKFTPNLIYKFSTQTDKTSLSESMYSSIIAILLVGGYIVIFFILIKMLECLGMFSLLSGVFSVFGVDGELVRGIVSGIIEVTTGCEFLSSIEYSFILVPIVCGLISFGGFSIHAQALTFLSPCGLTSKLFVLQKATQSLISIIVCFILSLCFL